MPEQVWRFWGRQDPRGRQKLPILAEVPGGTVDADGVATIRLYEPIDSWGEFWGTSAREFLDALDGVGSAREIRLHINSPGGEVYEAIAILNALRAHPARVVAHVDGLAASAASFIAAGADELVMGRNTELMIHDAWGIGIGDARTMRDLADRLDSISDNIASIYAAKAGGDVDSWRSLMLDETWLSAEEAVASGLADSVTGDAAGGEAAAARARFDLSAFHAAGRAAASAPMLPARRVEKGPADDGGRADRFAARRHQLAAGRHGLPA